MHKTESTVTESRPVDSEYTEEGCYERVRLELER